jgi:hypothetical protein
VFIPVLAMKFVFHCAKNKLNKSKFQPLCLSASMFFFKVLKKIAEKNWRSNSFSGINQNDKHMSKV